MVHLHSVALNMNSPGQLCLQLISIFDPSINYQKNSNDLNLESKIVLKIACIHLIDHLEPVLVGRHFVNEDVGISRLKLLHGC